MNPGLLKSDAEVDPTQNVLDFPGIPCKQTIHFNFLSASSCGFFFNSSRCFVCNPGGGTDIY